MPPRNCVNHPNIIPNKIPFIACGSTRKENEVFKLKNTQQQQSSSKNFMLNPKKKQKPMNYLQKSLK